jgi:hypothetical protein
MIRVRGGRDAAFFVAPFSRENKNARVGALFPLQVVSWRFDPPSFILAGRRARLSLPD